MSTYLALDDLRYVTYSHSDYLDVLQIHVDHIKKKKKKSLLINHCELPETISAHYDQIIFYDDALPYASRIYTGVSGIEEGFFVLMHDNDILISENSQIHMVATVFQHKKMHRLDLKHTPVRNPPKGSVSLNYKYQLCRHKMIPGNDYVYNVNPSMWDKKCLLEVMKKFHDLSYREIEKNEVQQFCSEKDFYFLYCPDPSKVKQAGHFFCSDIFVFLHITHGGKFLPTNGKSVHGQSYRDVEDRYKGIVNRYNLMENKRGFG